MLRNRPVTRNHGNTNIMDKAVAYVQKKNLEIPVTFKGKSFANPDTREHVSQSSKVDLYIGENSSDQTKIVLDLVETERLKCLQFPNQNPEIVLPSNLHINEHQDQVFTYSAGSISPSRSGGTADIGINSPVLHTKSVPCGLSHPSKIQ